MKNVDWEDWELLAIQKEYYEQDCEFDVSGCYLLGITELSKSEIRNYGIEDKDVEIVYVGESGSIMNRLNGYGENGSHLFDIIDYHLKQGFKICFCIYETSNKKDAQNLEYRLLREYNFDWNIKNNS